MKYYYGNDYKEALSNKPVSLTKKQVEQYEENYNIVISEENAAEEICDLVLDYDDYKLYDHGNKLKISADLTDFDDTVVTNICLLTPSGRIKSVGEWMMKSQDDDWIYCEIFA